MAGLRGNTAWWMLQKQTGKGVAGTPAVATSVKTPFSGGSIGPVRTIAQLAETDASRDQGVSFVRTGGVDGTPECYARDNVAGALLFYAMGADAITGTTPNYQHVITPANTIPYITAWQDVADTLFEQYQDCFVDSVEIRTTPGEPLSIVSHIVGLTPTRLTTDPSITPAIPLANGYVYNLNDATITLGGGVTALISSFDMTYSNNVIVQQTDAFAPYDVQVGQRQVSLSFDMIFETLAEYNKFHYGSAVGTALSKTLYTTSANFAFANGANNSMAFNFPTIAYETFPVAPNVNGDPITVSVRAVAQRPTSGAIVTATIANQVATY